MMCSLYNVEELYKYNIPLGISVLSKAMDAGTGVNTRREYSPVSIAV